MAKPTEPTKQEFTVSGKAIAWTVSVVSGLVVLIGGWFVIWDRIDTHWRLESVQVARDKEREAHDKAVSVEIQGVKEKAELDTKLLAKKAETGRAWVLWSVQDTKAYTASQFARVCRALKLPTDECQRQDADATQFRQEAMDAKRSAQDASKDK